MSTCCGRRCRMVNGALGQMCPESDYCLWCDTRRGLVELVATAPNTAIAVAELDHLDNFLDREKA